MMSLTHKQRLAHNAWQVVVDLINSDPEIAEIIRRDMVITFGTEAVPYVFVEHNRKGV